jgi:hypothetical protein
MKKQMIDDKINYEAVLLQRLRRQLRVCSLRHLPLLSRQRKDFRAGGFSHLFRFD